jgi:glutaconate CoA-transferase subunit B
MDFGGPDHAIRIVSLHPGVTTEEVEASTGFPLARADAIAQTRAPSDAELSIIARLDPNDVRAGVIKDDPKVRDAS